MPDNIEKQRLAAYRHLRSFTENRIQYYTDPRKVITVDKLLGKDLVMFAARGVKTSDEFAAEAFRAIESSSEETVIGNTWQALIAEISADTIDTGDLTTVRDNTLWICQLKSQTNTVNASSFPQELRELKEKVRLQSRSRRASKQPVKAAYCVLRAGKSIDETRIYHPSADDRANQDIDGFEYRYLQGKAFWRWLADVDGPDGLVNDFGLIQVDNIVELRNAALRRITAELNELLDTHELPHTISGVAELKKKMGSAK